MSGNLKITIFFLLILTSCCKEGRELSPYLLTDSEKSSIPYLPNQAMRFAHSNGFEFDMVVADRQTSWKATDTEHCGDDWSKYESLTIGLNSLAPELHITLVKDPIDIFLPLIISINGKSSFPVNLRDEPSIDTLTLNGHTFKNIYQSESFWSDTLVITPMHILYTTEVGIIQITMSDNTKFTINE